MSGIGNACEVGDVVVSPIVAFDCLKWLRSEPFARQSFKSEAANAKLFALPQRLFKANAERLPPDNKRPPRIIPCELGEVSSAHDRLLRF